MNAIKLMNTTIDIYKLETRVLIYMTMFLKVTKNSYRNANNNNSQTYDNNS